MIIVVIFQLAYTIFSGTAMVYQLNTFTGPWLNVYAILGMVALGTAVQVGLGHKVFDPPTHSGMEWMFGNA